ncbi:capsule polysaccharide biosynthesis protein [Histoplasma capsulatum H143]|uniref:Capsule polysaccharide biosynthesis protein n=1 Tax=Ajellomyces capsulatus (strain H143) TaxID=544712 RepID=C6HGG3_AJECH|nr:capsule polysaccharide biosynthesis protein [Histoplasma capsulatum H143]
MKPSQFTIPPEFQAELRHVEPLDARTDEEIISSLDVFTPVESEKNIWAYWHSGIKSMPGWCKRNVVNWSRLCGPSWTIRVLDNIPDSPNHALKYIPRTCFRKHLSKGLWRARTPANIARTFYAALVCISMGVYIWTWGTCLFRSLDQLCWSILADDSSPRNVAVPSMARAICSPVDQSDDSHRDVEPSAPCVACWGRLCRLEDAGDGFSCADYAKDNILWFDCLNEDWPVGFREQSAFDALATRLDADPESEEYRTAYKVVWHWTQLTEHRVHILESDSGQLNSKKIIELGV